MIEVDFEDIKNRIKEHPVLKDYLNKMVCGGLSEDEAVEVMLSAYFERINF